MKFTVMVSKQGTACHETALCHKHDTADWRRQLEQESAAHFPADYERAVEWKRGVENEALRCAVCGAC